MRISKRAVSPPRTRSTTSSSESVPANSATTAGLEPLFISMPSSRLYIERVLKPQEGYTRRKQGRHGACPNFLVQPSWRGNPALSDLKKLLSGAGKLFSDLEKLFSDLEQLLSTLEKLCS